LNHNIQTDTSNEALVTATRANMSDLFRLVSRAFPEEHLENSKFTRWWTPLPHPWFNGVLSKKPYEESDDSFIEEAIQYFFNKGVHTFTWWVDPPIHTSDWKGALSKHGFGFDNDTPGMALDLQNLNESIGTVDGLEVRTVADKESMRTWARIFTIGYGLPPTWEDIVHDIWIRLGFDYPMKSYLGYLNDKPVATSCLHYGGGAAGIYSVATLPEARGRGIGAMLTLQPLQEARDLGYRIGTLQSSSMGFNIYKRLGFKHLCQVEDFYISTK